MSSPAADPLFVVIRRSRYEPPRCIHSAEKAQPNNPEARETTEPMVVFSRAMAKKHVHPEGLRPETAMYRGIAIQRRQGRRDSLFSTPNPHFVSRVCAAEFGGRLTSSMANITGHDRFRGQEHTFVPLPKIGMICRMTTSYPASTFAPLNRGHRGDAAAFSVYLCACVGCGLGAVLLWPFSGGRVEIGWPTGG